MAHIVVKLLEFPTIIWHALKLFVNRDFVLAPKFDDKLSEQQHDGPLKDISMPIMCIV